MTALRADNQGRIWSPHGIEARNAGPVRATVTHKTRDRDAKAVGHVWREYPSQQ